MLLVDDTITNVALPTIGRDLHFSESNLSWVVNAYLLTFGGLLLVGGRLADRFGPRRMFAIEPRRASRSPRSRRGWRRAPGCWSAPGPGRARAGRCCRRPRLALLLAGLAGGRGAPPRARDLGGTAGPRGRDGSRRRRRARAADELALDLLHQRASRGGGARSRCPRVLAPDDRAGRRAVAQHRRRRAGDDVAARARLLGRGDRHLRMDLGADARRSRARAGARPRVRRLRAPLRAPAAAARAAGPAAGVAGRPGDLPGRRWTAGDVLLPDPVPPARVGLRTAADGPVVPAVLGRDGDRLGADGSPAASGSIRGSRS